MGSVERQKRDYGEKKDWSDQCRESIGLGMVVWRACKRFLECQGRGLGIRGRNSGVPGNGVQGKGV